MEHERIDELTHKIIAAAIEVHRVLGPGLFEHTYQTVLMYELAQRGLNAKSEVIIPLIYKGVKLDFAYRADIIVEDEIIVELKATDYDNKLYYKQLLTYLKICDKRVGLLINFNREKLTDGVKRVVNNL